MNISLTLRIATRALIRNKLRTVLTMLGLVIGVAAVIAMLSIGNGAKASMDERIAGMGTNTVHIWPGFRKGKKRGGQEERLDLTVDDWKAVDDLPEVMESCPMAQSNASLVVGSSNWSCDVVGTSPSYLTIRNWPLEAGRMFTESEINSAASVVVLGFEVKKELFGAADAVGETVRIGNFPFRVVGVLIEKGNSGFGSRDNSALVPYTTHLQKVRKNDSLSYLTLQAPTREAVKALEIIAVDFLNERHHITDPENGGFSAFNMAKISDMADQSSRIFTLLLGGIASVSLLVGGIGVMNIMLVSVTERIREIGIRMAVGARGIDILSQFLAEAVALSLSGGAIGVALGYFISQVIAKYAEWPAVVSQSSVLLAFGTSVFIGVFFGFYPALSASRLDPIQALRHE